MSNYELIKLYLKSLEEAKDDKPVDEHEFKVCLSSYISLPHCRLKIKGNCESTPEIYM